MFRDSFYESKILNSLIFPILDSSEIGFSIVDGSGKILEVNEAFCELFGYERSEVVGFDYSRVVMEENQEYSKRNHEDFMENGFYDKREVLLRHKDGRFFFAQFIDIKFNDEKGNIYRATTYTDVTERKHNELVHSVLLKIPQIADVSESMETMFRNIHASIEQLMPAFNFYIALYDEETDKLSYPYFSNEFDYEDSEMMNKGSYDLITNYILKNGKSVLFNDKKLENIFGNNTLCSSASQEDGTSKGQNPKPQAVLGAVLRIKDAPAGVITLIDFNKSDVFNKCHQSTIEKVAEQLSLVLERKKYEEQLIISMEKAEESNRIKSAFLTQMSHEIRTPINTILSFTWLLKEKFGDSSDSDAKDFFTIIEGGAKRLVRTIDLILNMSQLQNETIEVKPVEFDMAENVLKPLVKEAGQIASRKNIKISFVNKASSQKIIGDEVTISQIFEQLIDNAIKYTPQGCVEITQYLDNDSNMCVKVKDSGIGISQEYLPQLFTMFSQEEMGYTRKYDGNGLGLALVKRLAELNKARVKVESEKGKGSSFTVIFNQAQ
ncbi:MAG: PAS domain-containing sensor histidine kinase [Bacteroidota bacterium]|nr:PAS domain-containing sensor histidine kinase [Bacteroidota bacterium]MDP4192895.1 PAS domain-containing sensor histidine kinase [Bacteroidota bacterium]MDP4194631.1 PAS domain-containing sensor histidine kinase [Bacteroidota bacterium]